MNTRSIVDVDSHCECPSCELSREIAWHGGWEEYYSTRKNKVILTCMGRHDTTNISMRLYHKDMRLKLSEEREKLKHLCPKRNPS